MPEPTHPVAGGGGRFALVTGSVPSRGVPRSARRWLPLVVGVAAAAVLVAVAAFVWFTPGPGMSSKSSGGSGSTNEIGILPSPGTRSACIVGTPGVPRTTLALDNGTFQANTYSVPQGTVGHVGMCYGAESGAMFAYANWTHVGATGWFSYPQVTYGVNDWLGATSTYTNQSSLWTQPQNVAQVTNESVWATLNYSFRAPPATDVDGYDFSIDNFLTETLPPEFEQGPFVEVMVWFAHHVTYPFEFLHWAMPTLDNATVSVEPWDVGYWCHGPDNGTDANVSFDFSFEGQGSAGLAAGTIGVNLSAIFTEVEALMPSVTCWTGPTTGFSQFHLDETDLGSEDGAIGGTSFNYNWTVDSYCFRVHVRNLTASDLSCQRVASPTAVSWGGSPTIRTTGTEGARVARNRPTE